MPRKRNVLPLLSLGRKRRRSGPGPVALGAAAAAVAAAGAAAFRAARHRGGGVASAPAVPEPVVPGPPSDEPVADAVERSWQCACGQEYRVRGEDRHRVYWLPDAAISDPVLDPECPICGRPLPRDHESAVGIPDSGKAPASVGTARVVGSSPGGPEKGVAGAGDDGAGGDRVATAQPASGVSGDVAGGVGTADDAGGVSGEAGSDTGTTDAADTPGPDEA